MKGINLIPEDIQKAWRVRKWRLAFIGAGACYVLFLIAVFALQRAELSRLKAEEAALVSAKDALAGRSSEYALLTKRLSEIRAAEGELSQRIGVASELKDKRVSWSFVLKNLSHEVPKGVWLRSLSTSDVQGTTDKKVKFLGSATNNRAVADFIFKIENSGRFRDATLSYSQKRDLGGNIVYDFEVYATLRKTGEVLYEW
ncbi:MAG: PilN domain-containing protein [Deltaproteobacteria bacterium]|nr:PilN domain-containing protein [Deltaproteobacteria bacterium]